MDNIIDAVPPNTKPTEMGGLYFIAAILVLKRRMLSNFVFRCIAMNLAMVASTGGCMLSPVRGKIDEFLLGTHVRADQGGHLARLEEQMRKLESVITDTRELMIFLLKSPEDDENGDLREKCLTKMLDGCNREMMLYARTCYQRVPITKQEMAIRHAIFAEGETEFDKAIAATEQAKADEENQEADHGLGGSATGA